MTSFDVTGPIVVDVRNAAGSVRINLAGTHGASADVDLVPGGPMAVVDEIVRAFGGRHDEERGSRWWEPPSGSQAQAMLERVRVSLTEHAGQATLVVDTDPATRGWRTAFAVRITAPERSVIRAATQSADVQVTGTSGDLRARTASGDLQGDDVEGSAEISTASGDLRLRAVRADLHCRTASGDVDVAEVGGSAVVHTASGDVRLRAPAGDVEVRTVSGDIRIADLTEGLAQLTAVSGTIDVGIHPGSLAAVSLTTISGNTRSDLEVLDDAGARADAGSGDGNAVGDGPVTAAAVAHSGGTENPAEDDRGAAPSGPLLDIRARTTSGDIRLRRSVSV